MKNVADWPSVDKKQLFSYLSWNSYRSERHKLFYVATPKVACTSIKWWFAALEGHAQALRGITDSGETGPDMIIHDSFHRVAPDVTHLAPEALLEPLSSDSYFRFAVVRNPYKRVFSAWQQKLLVREPLQIKPYLESDFFHRRIASQADIATAFEVFLEHLAINEAPSFWDVHWVPQATLLRPDLINYSQLVQIENAKELSLALAERLGESIPNPFESRRANESLIPYLAELITARSSELIRSLYADDFDTFGYSKVVPEGKEAFSKDQFDLALKAIDLVRGRHKRLGERSLQITGLTEAVTERDGRLQQLGEAIAERDARLNHLGEAVMERDNRLTRLGEAVGERDVRLTRLSEAVAERDARLTKLGEAITERDVRLGHLGEAVAERDARLTQLGEAVAERDVRLTQLGEAVAERDGRLTQLGEAVAERDARLTQLGEAVAERDVRLTQLGEAVAERDGRLTQLGEAVAERDGRLTQLGEAVTERDARLSRLEATASEAGKQLMQLTESVAEKRAQVAHLTEALAECEGRAKGLTERAIWYEEEIETRARELAARDLQIVDDSHRIGALDQRVSEQTENLARLSDEASRLRASLSGQEQEVLRLRAELSQVYESKSWRITKPARLLRNGIGRKQYVRWRQAASAGKGGGGLTVLGDSKPRATAKDRLLTSLASLFNWRGPDQNLDHSVRSPGVDRSQADGKNTGVSAQKLLLIIHELSLTGAPRAVLNLANAIYKNRQTRPIITSPVDGPLRNEIEAAGYSVEICPWLLQEIKKETTESRYLSEFDRIVVTSLSSYDLLRNVKDFANNLTWWIHEDNHSFEFIQTERAPDLARLFDACEAVWVGSPVCSLPVLKYVPPEKMQPLLYGCEDIPAANRVHESGVIVFTLVGSVEPRKGQDIFLSAIEKLPKDTRSKAIFRIIGSNNIDWFESFYRDILARASLIEEVECLPNMPYEQLKNYYSEAHVIVSASRGDPMPFTITEGLMSSKTCLCSSIIGHAHFLQHGESGLIFENESAEDLSQKIAWILENPSRLEVIGKSGREVFQRHFHMDGFVRNVHSIM